MKAHVIKDLIYTLLLSTNALFFCESFLFKHARATAKWVIYFCLFLALCLCIFVHLYLVVLNSKIAYLLFQ